MTAFGGVLLATSVSDINSLGLLGRDIQSPMSLATKYLFI